ncbi:MAG: polysaccharide biosynthesis/export family protein [Candidatus Korobacteraceae bacterium]
MSIRFSCAATAVLAIVTFGSVCRISAQVQTSPADKAASPSPIPSANGDAPAEMTAASTKVGVPPVEESSSKGKVHPDLKAVSAPKDKDKVSDLYIVGVADGLFISVWKEQDLSGAVVVRPDGMITVPVIGDVHVAGLTTTQVQNLLTEKLKDVVAEPQVTVIVRDIRSRKAYLVGKVARPGSISLTSPETVLQILAESGGPSALSKSQKMYVLRTVGDKQKRIEFNYKKVLAGTQPDLVVEVGDIIVVP